MVQAPQTLALLAFDAVLLPGAPLLLRMVEPRYLDLVREGSRPGVGLGVCLVIDGEPPGRGTAAFGTEACIEDFSTGADGVLMLRVRGRRRFRVCRTRVRDNGLIMATVDWRPRDPDDPLRPEHATLALVLERILDQAGVGATPAQLDDAAWVGWRLGEWLPLSDAQRQSLLQEDDPHARLDRLLTLLS